MEKPERTEQMVDDQEEVDLKGSLASVFILGIFIILSWLGVWYLYIIR